MNNKTVVNLGVQQFDKLIEENKFYVDKTGFIREWWDSGADVTLITRPRRFGKTLNMSMVECFFSNQYADRGELFEGLSVWDEKTPEGEYRFRELQGTFPVIFVSFASIESPTYKGMLYQISEEVSILYARNRYLLEGNLIRERERK